MAVDLDKLFPAAPPANRKLRTPQTPTGVATGVGRNNKGRTRKEDVSTKWAGVYALELRNYTQLEIATALGMSPGYISTIVNDERYIKYREEHLAALDHEFVSMKPLAFQALRGGLQSADENTALRASEQWFKGAGFGGFSKQEQPSTTATAEDIAAQLLSAVQVNVNVSVNSSDGS